MTVRCVIYYEPGRKCVVHMQDSKITTMRFVEKCPENGRSKIVQ